MDDHFSSIVEYCDSCNLSFDPWNIRQYKVLYHGSKIHDQDKISLCHVCSKIAKYAEQLFNNIQGNSLINTEVQINKKPIKNLCLFNLGTLQLSDDSCDTDTSYSIISAKNGEILTECGKLNVKVELELCDDAIFHEEELDESIIKLEHFDVEDYTPQDVISEYNVKEEKKIEINERRKKKENSKETVIRNDETIIKLEHFNVEDNSPQEDVISEYNVKGEKKIEIYERRKKTENSEETVIRNENSDKEKQITIPKARITTEQYMQEKLELSKTDNKYLNSQYKCADCVVGYFHEENYLKHMEKHSESAGQFECDLCKIRLKTKDRLHAHLYNHLIRYKCTHCNVVRNQLRTIQEHLYCVHKIGITQKYKCDKCSKEYNREVTLRKHKYSKHRPREKITCTYCQKIYSSLDTLRNHITVKHPEELKVKQEKKHICQECGAAFRAASLLKTHMQKHSDRRDYYCVECDKSFKTELGLNNHLTTTTRHTSHVELPFACAQCEKRFLLKSSLNRHLNANHLNAKPFKCDQCPKAYNSNWAVSRHKLITHEGFKLPLKFKCEICDKVFARKRVLEAHTRTHTGERPFQCGKCEATFTQSSSLHTHNKLVHLKLKRNRKKK